MGCKWDVNGMTAVRVAVGVIKKDKFKEDMGTLNPVLYSFTSYTLSIT